MKSIASLINVDAFISIGIHLCYNSDVRALSIRDSRAINVLMMTAMKEKLGYGDGPLIICSVGGTAIGVELLNLCSRTYRILKDKLLQLQMVLICGPRILESLGKPVDYQKISFDGAIKAAELIEQLL